MRLLLYVSSLFQLIFRPSHFYKNVITSIEDQTNISQWKIWGKHLFFDIDDTLGVHRGGLNADICHSLDLLAENGKSVHLLTNCSHHRAEDHQRRLEEFSCKAELWTHGMKPNYHWLRREIEQRDMLLSDCCFFGDRPTMDLWMAFKAGFGYRVWVTGWRELSPEGKGPLGWIQSIEWKALEPHLLAKKS
jgi:ribonucleotide monophosphatase NagD (HAD superfamily)